MKAAPCSWRVGMNRTEESASESRMSRISSPGRPKTYRTPSFSRHRTISSDAFIALRDPDRLDVHELADAVLGELAPIARALDAAERQARIRLHDAVHANRPRVDLRRHALGRGAIPRPQRGAEAEGRVVGETHGVRFVLSPDDRGHRAEGLLVERRHALVHVGEQRRRIEGARAGWNLAAEEPAGATRDGLFDLTVQGVAEIHARLGPDLGVARQRIADAAGTKLLEEPGDELIGHRLDDDEALGRDTALAAVDQPRVGRGAGRRGHVRVGEDDEGIAAAQLEHGLLQRAARLLGHLAAGTVTPRQRHGGDPRIAAVTLTG